MPTLELLDVDALRETVTTFRDVMRAHAADINRLNVYPVPDGDTGTNMARTLDAVVAEMAGAGAGLDATCDAIAHGSLMGARGNSGVILSQVLRGLVSTLRGQRDVTGATVAAALTASSAAAYTAVLKPIEGTILTVVRESAAGAERAAADGASLSEVLRAARDAGRVALAATPELLPVLKDAGVVDAGGAGYLLLLDAALHVVDGEPLPEPIGDADPGAVGAAFEAVARRASGVAGELDVSEQRYEVMFLCDLADEHIEAMKQAWGEIGDSIVVVGGDGLWNCHVHSNDIGAAIEAPLDLGGRPFQIRVTDLFEEVAAEHAQRESELVAAMSGDGGVTGRRAPGAHLRRRRRQQRPGHRRLVRPARRAGHRERRADAQPVDGRAARRRRTGQRRARGGAARQQEHHPGRRAGRRPHRQDRARRAHPVDARGPRRAHRLRPGGRRADQRPGDAPRQPRRSRPAR